jgi:hypothetical protein
VLKKREKLAKKKEKLRKKKKEKLAKKRGKLLKKKNREKMLEKTQHPPLLNSGVGR